MKNYRMSKGTTEHYTSLDSLRSAWGLKELKPRRTNDEEKLKAQREKFLGTCKGCGNPLTFLGYSNVLCCTNPECKGIKNTKTDSEGNETVFYTPVYRVLDDVGFEIGNNLFN